ncbi:MAG TPA: hypothetical protein VG871_12590, partial [Vicinamibacterales bacterium]|nr:hypothetical protein [Vicinamibacterales bacterium]
MTRWEKIKAVATFEFLGTVKRTGYLVTTFGMPVFMAIYAGIVAIPAYYAAQKDAEPSVFGVVDRSGIVALQGDARPGASRLPASLQAA